jgi:hypothetical protein
LDTSGYPGAVARPTYLIPTVLVFFACGDASFRVKMPEGFREAHRTVSVVGIYREGRLSPDYFDQIAPTIEGALGRGCDQGYGEALKSADPTLYEELDQESRQDGVTDDVLARMSPGALGDTLMVIQLYGPIGAPGKRPTKGGASAPLPQTPAPYSRGAGSMSGRGPRAGGGEEPRAPQSTSDVQIAATLYSRKDHSFVGEVALTYNGKDVDKALRRFGERLNSEMSGAKCAGWKWPADAAPAPGAPPPEPPPT